MKKTKTTFKRLVSNLPYNPSLISQVSFYAKRLKQESSVRRLGFVFIALTFFVQLFAVIAPPQHSLARDTDNDMYTGGFASQDQAVAACTDNVRDYASVLDYVGISCDAVRAGVPVTIRSTDFGGQLMSMGRKPYGIANEQPVMINGTEYFVRSLWGWDQGSPSTYRAIDVVTKTGAHAYLLYDCGNLTTVGPPKQPPPEEHHPVKTVQCSILLADHSAGEVIKKGTTVTISGQVSSTNMEAGDTVDMAYDYVNSDTGAAVVQPTRVNGIHFNNNTASDPNKHAFVMNEPGHYTFRMAAVYNGALVPGSFVAPCATSVSVEKPVLTCKDTPNAPQCKPCEKAKPGKPEECIVKSKKASNVTTKVSDANNTTAHAGDVIDYFLYTQNTGKETVKKFVVAESMSDVLDYADITDLHGGKLDKDNTVIWVAVDLKPGQIITNQITVKVKDPIPSTPVSTSNPGKFDMNMNNFYGNAVNIKLPPPIVKVVEKTGQTLPNTGPGENVAIGFVLFTVVGYFFARSRLLNKELDLVRQDYAAGDV